jgi:hypothetical protein
MEELPRETLDAGYGVELATDSLSLTEIKKSEELPALLLALVPQVYQGTL